MEKFGKKLIIAVVVIAVIFAYLFFAGNEARNEGGKSRGIFSGKSTSSDATPSDREISQDANETIQNISSSGSSGGSAGGGGSPSASVTSCSIHPISYSIHNINKDFECLDYQGGVCLSKSINCSAEVYNLDAEISGTFRIELKFVDRSQDPLTLDSEFGEFFLGPGEFGTMQGIRSLEGQNPDIDCFFSTLEVPEERTCS